MRLLSLLGVFAVCSMVSAQSSRIKEVNLMANSAQQVFVTWIMNAGSTCNAPQVQHSLDGENFKTVYTYPGVCGGTSEEESYSWAHSKPKKYAINYYRIRVDEGELTLAKEIDLQSNLAEDKLIVYPVPLGEKLNLELRNENDLLFEVSIFDLQGRIHFNQAELKGTKQHLNIGKLNSGIYLLEVKFENGEREVRRVAVL
jgi:hypothetical protein